MQIEQIAGLKDLLLGANGGILGAAIWVLWKVNVRLTRDESIKRDYPPHRHVNGSVIYPDDYPPSPVGKLNV